MNAMNTVLILCILLVVSLIVIVVVFRGRKCHNSDYPSSTMSKQKVASDNYIAPAEFNVGLIKNKPYKAANLCDDQALYPMRNLDVEYGLPPIPNDCPCTQFIRPP